MVNKISNEEILIEKTSLPEKAQPELPANKINKRIKWISLSLLILAALFLALLAFGFGELTIENCGLYISRRFFHLKLIEWVTILTPVIAFAIAVFTHRLDRKHKGGGLRDVILSVKPFEDRFNTDPGVLSASMTKQSVLAAIAAILLTIVQKVKNDLSQGVQPTDPIDFSLVAAELSTIGFLSAVVLLLISMKCYDYANRFNIDEKYKLVLISKGLDLDIGSWYILFFSFSLGVATVSTSLSILLSFGAGFLLWWYYFIHPRSDKTNQINSDSQVVQDEIENRLEE